MHKRIRSLLAATCLVSATAATLVTGAGSGAAAPSSVNVKTTPCQGWSPNIIDQPFRSTTATVMPNGNGTAVVWFFEPSSLWFVTGYQTRARLDWHNLTTGHRGSSVDEARTAYTTGHHLHYFLNTGRGKVVFTLHPVNSNGLITIPASSCTGTVLIT